jgi:asparagine synthase (glutamine-hydrolysing)
MGDDLERLVTILDEPQADPAALNNLYISAMARRSGLKVLLSGTGGDDIFSGYRRHAIIAAGELGDALPRPLLALLAKAGQRIRGDGTIARRLRRASDMIGRDGDERILHALEWLGASEVSRLCSNDLPGAPQSAPLRDALRETVGSPALERLLRLDQRFFLADHNLNYTDKTGMAESVEIRVPFLDPQLMAFAARLDARQKLRRGRGKWILRKAMEGLLPNQIIYRPKTGFGVPLRSWLRGGLREMAEELTSETVVGARGLFDPAAVAQLRNDTLSGRRDGAYPLLATMVIELWCRAFADARPASHSPERVVAFV